MPVIYLPAPRPLPLVEHLDSDWIYNSHLAAMPSYCPGLRVETAHSLPFDAATYTRRGLQMLRRRTGVPIPARWSFQLSQSFRLHNADAARSGAGAVLSYERCPSNARLPVIWISSPTDTDKLRERGVPEAEIRREIAWKHAASRRAAAVVVTTESNRRVFEEQIRPDKPVHVIPFFIPAGGLDPAAIDRKWREPEAIELVFVGRAARRKRLPELLEAYRMLLAAAPGRFRLTIVSTFLDGAVDIPALPGITRIRELTHARCLALMATSHYMVMPSREECYGWTYVEAMAQGAIPVAPDMRVQRDILDDGRAGLLIGADGGALAGALADALLGSASNLPEAGRMARYGAELWRREHAPAVVAARFAELAAAVAEKREPVCASA